MNLSKGISRILSVTNVLSFFTIDSGSVSTADYLLRSAQ
jgi:hypothetical protein